jgi:hypothetical protein
MGDEMRLPAITDDYDDYDGCENMSCDRFAAMAERSSRESFQGEKVD